MCNLHTIREFHYKKGLHTEKVKTFTNVVCIPQTGRVPFPNCAHLVYFTPVAGEYFLATYHNQLS